MLGDAPVRAVLGAPLPFRLDEYVGDYHNERSLQGIRVELDDANPARLKCTSYYRTTPVGWDAEARKEMEAAAGPMRFGFAGKDACLETRRAAGDEGGPTVVPRGAVGMEFLRGPDGTVQWLRRNRLLRWHPPTPQARL